MTFKELRELTETQEQKDKAAEGFEERLKAYEKKFKYESLEPSAEFYDRVIEID